MDEIEIEDGDVVVPAYPSILFEVRDDQLRTLVSWPEDTDPEVFSKVIAGVQKGEWAKAVLGSILAFGEAVEDEDFAEHLLIMVQQQMSRTKSTPYVRPRAAIPMLSRRGAGE